VGRKLRGFGSELRHKPIVAKLRRSWKLGKGYVPLERVQNMARDFDKVVHDQEHDNGFGAVNRPDDPHFFIGFEYELDVSNVLRKDFEINRSEFHGVKSLSVEQLL
jgi:hypothetical protein